MIYHNFNFVESYSNASGNKRSEMVLGELGKLIKNHPEEVVLALRDADIKVPNNYNKGQLIKLVVKNKSNLNMIKNLSILIYASSYSDNDIDVDSEFLGKNRDKSGETDKQGIFKSIGSWFAQRKERRQQRKESRSDKDGLFKKVGGFVKNNQDTISSVGIGLYDALQNRGGESTIGRNASTSSQILNQSKPKEAGFFEKNKTAIIVVGVLAVVGYFAWKKFGNKGK